MERQRVALALLIVACLGIILSGVGTFIAAGLDQGGTLYNTLSTAFPIFVMLFIVSLALNPDLSKAKQNQSEAESDSSLL